MLTLTDGNPKALYTLQTTPARPAADKKVFIYVISIFSNPGNSAGEVRLDQPVDTAIYPKLTLDEGENVVITLPTPIPVGTTGVFARAYRGTTVIGVDVQILGLER